MYGSEWGVTSFPSIISEPSPKTKIQMIHKKFKKVLAEIFKSEMFYSLEWTMRRTMQERRPVKGPSQDISSYLSVWSDGEMHWSPPLSAHTPLYVLKSKDVVWPWELMSQRIWRNLDMRTDVHHLCAEVCGNRCYHLPLIRSGGDYKWCSCFNQYKNENVKQAHNTNSKPEEG